MFLSIADIDVEGLLNQPGFCRLCVVNYDPGNMTEIFDNKDGDASFLVQQIKTVTNFEVERNGLPTSICPRCVSELDRAHGFIQLCVTGNDFLRNELFDSHDQETDDHGAKFEVKVESGISAENCIKSEQDASDMTKHSDDPKCFESFLDMPVLSPQNIRPATNQSDDENDDETPSLELDSFDCAHCNAKFPSRLILEKHVLASLTKPCAAGDVENCSQDQEKSHESLCFEKANRPCVTVDQANQSDEDSEEETRVLEMDSFDCAHCHTKFTSRSSLKKHLVAALAKDENRELLRNNEDAREQELSINKFVVIFPQKTFYCAKCLTKFCDKENYIKHVVDSGCTRFRSTSNHFKEVFKDLQCPNCQRLFSKSSFVVRHLRLGICMNSHNRIREKSLKCPSCYVSYARERNLRQHLLFTRCEKLLSSYAKRKSRCVCASCNQVFANKCNLKRHLIQNRCLQSKSGIANEKIKCPFCPTVFIKIESLRRHLQFYLCKKSSRDKDSVERVHCPVCQTVYKSIDTLETHLRLGQCKKSLSNTTQERQCKFCEMVFLEPSGVKRHMILAHSFKPPFVHCPYCQKTFTYSKNLRRHLRLSRCTKAPLTKPVPQKLASSSLIFKCALCSGKSSSKQNLAEHINSHCVMPCKL